MKILLSISALLIVCLALPSTLFAQQSATADALPEETFVAMRIDTSDAEVQELATKLLSEWKDLVRDMELASIDPSTLLSELESDSVKEIVVGATSFGQAEEMVYVLTIGTNETFNKQVIELMDRTADIKWEAATVDDNTYLGTPSFVQRLKNSQVKANTKAATNRFFAEAFEQRSDSKAIQIVFAPSANHRHGLTSAMPTLPESLGGGSMKELVSDWEWLRAEIVMGDQPRIDLHIEMSEGGNAAAVQAFFSKSLAQLAAHRIAQRVFPGIKEIKEFPRLENQDGNLVSSVAAGEQFFNVADSSLNYAAAQYQTERSRNTLKDVAYAAHYYFDANRTGTFPARAIFSESGEPLLSWRVSLLPHLGPEAAALYQEFHLDEPWDSDHNKALIPKMPRALLTLNSSLDPSDGKSNIAMPSGKGMAGDPMEGLELRKTLDGLSNTALFVETSDESADIWTKPDKFVPNLVPGYPDLGQAEQPWILIAAGDGSVSKIRRDAKTDLIRAYFGYSDGLSVRDIYYRVD